MVAMTSRSGPAITAWGLWKQRQIVVPASIITSVLLLCDAWFDLLTANGHRDLIASAASAMFGEVPLAIMLILISIRALYVGARARAGHPGLIAMAYPADHIPRPFKDPVNPWEFFKWLADEEELPDPMAGQKPPMSPTSPSRSSLAMSSVGWSGRAPGGASRSAATQRCRSVAPGGDHSGGLADARWLPEQLENF
jgi:hypothetical protein